MMSKEQVYTEIITPALQKAAQTCIDNGMPLLFIVEYDSQKVGEVRWFGDPKSQFIKTMSRAISLKFSFWDKETSDGNGKEVQS